MDAAHLVLNLAQGLAAALVGGALAVRFGQSPLLGYIVAGIVLGPFTPGFSSDPGTVESLAEIGIVFMLFAIGMEFPIKELARNGRPAVLGGLAQVLITLGAGWALARALGWSPTNALVAGAVLSNSSSTVAGKVFLDRGETESPHGRLAIAMSSVQDLSTVVLLVVLAAAAGPAGASFFELAKPAGIALLFFALAVPVAGWVLPRVFDRVAAFRNRELFILAVGATALGLAHAGTHFGLSRALTAFVAGVVVGQTAHSHRILGELGPLRDLFVALFFVSVGMFVDPRVLVTHPVEVVLWLGAIVLLKGPITAACARLAGAPTGRAVLVGAALAQSAEFSFLLAREGVSLGALGTDRAQILVAAAVLSIFLSPLLHDWASRFVARRAASEHARAKGPAEEPLSNHAVVLGHGRVGAHLVDRLTAAGIEVAVIDELPLEVQRVRARGIRAMQGPASNEQLLERIGVARARLVVVALPGKLDTRLVVERVRRLAPDVPLFARTHSGPEERLLAGLGAHAVVGEVELAHTLARLALEVVREEREG